MSAALIVGAVLWVIVTFVAVYFVSFIVDRYLLLIGWEGASVGCVVTMTVFIYVDSLFFDMGMDNVTVFGVSAHLICMLVVSIHHERIQEFIGYPYKV